jgi:integrase
VAAATACIGDGCDVVWLSRQLGHANPSITLNVYSHEFAARDKAEKHRDDLERGFGALL